MSTPADREWTTTKAPPREQFALWEQAVDQAFVPVSVTARHAGAFDSGVTVRRLGPVEVAAIVSPAQTVRRTATQISRAAGDVYFLNLPISGQATVGQHGRSSPLSSGDFALVDGDRPFRLEFPGRFRQISLKIPREVLRPRLIDDDAVVGRAVPGHTGLGLVASTAIQSAVVAAGTLDRAAARALGDQLLELVALSLGHLRPQPVSTPQTLLLQAALDEIERSLGDPDLSATVVAGRIGVSVRYLHSLFALHGPSFGRWVLARRLELAHRDLRDPRRLHWSITRIAHERGFSDPSYFSRVFRTRYGLTPRELRPRTGPALSS